MCKTVQITNEKSGFPVGQVVEFVREIDDQYIFVNGATVAKKVLKSHVRFIDSSGKLI